MSQYKRLSFLLAVFVLVFIVAAAQKTNVPLYDGIGFPDESYRYVKKPTSAPKTKPVSTAKQSIQLDSGTNPESIYVSSNELGPQITLYFPANSLQAGRTATSITVSATPKAIDSHPSDGSIAGNIYTVSATSNGGSVNYIKQTSSASYISLRLPQGEKAGPTIEYRPLHGSWGYIQTEQVGNDIYQSEWIGFGDYALVSASNGTTATKKGTGIAVKTSAIAALVVGMVVVLVLVIRSRAPAKEHERPKAKN